MKDTLLPLLACPACGGELALTATHREAAEIMTGSLQCKPCRADYPIRHGVPRFADVANDERQRETAANFGAQWLVFDEVQSHHEQQFRDWIAPVTPEFVEGNFVLEGGCGKGRHTRVIADWGAQAVIGVDLSDAVEAAFRNTRDLPNAHIIQADIYRLPLRQEFDYAFSVGVLHHLPNPRGGFTSLVKHLNPGGAISAWIYGRENNEWIINFVDPLRKTLTSKLPTRWLYALSYLPTIVLSLALKLIYAPLSQTSLKKRLFYSNYLCYIARFPFREIHNIVHDHLTAPVAYYIRREELADWYKEIESVDYEIAWHNQNSWRGFGFLAASIKSGEAKHGN
ncbi:MAG: methyltransferase domain-containing protein [Acidobacteria bacterium]|nr:methyltransferase domain-containing protein [Acidobacteriota bacterium]